MTIVKIDNFGKVDKLITELPKKEERILSRSNRQFIKNVQKSAKLMAPRDTGELVESIKSKATKTKGKTQQYLLEVTAPHASAQEYGFTPHFAFIRNSSKLPPGVYFVKKNTPFIRPAIERNFSRFSQSLNNGIRRSIRA